MTKYEIILEALQEKVDSGELTFEDAEVLNEAAYSRYYESTERELTADEYLEAMEYELFDETANQNQTNEYFNRKADMQHLKTDDKRKRAIEAFKDNMKAKQKLNENEFEKYKNKNSTAKSVPDKIKKSLKDVQLNTQSSKLSHNAKKAQDKYDTDQKNADNAGANSERFFRAYKAGYGKKIMPDEYDDSKYNKTTRKDEKFYQKQAGKAWKEEHDRREEADKAVKKYEEEKQAKYLKYKQSKENK